jgi:predicted NBD/HSP70 family sugar kinase
VTGGSVVVGTGVALGWAVVGVAVRGTGVADGEGDELGDADVDGDGLADGAATCCEEITAAPRTSRATSATAAKTVNTVDHRSA